MELINAELQIQLAKETRQLPVRKKVRWPGVLVFEAFPGGLMVSEHARIRLLTSRVRWRHPQNGENLVEFVSPSNWNARMPWQFSFAWPLLVAGPPSRCVACTVLSCTDDGARGYQPPTRVCGGNKRAMPIVPGPSNSLRSIPRDNRPEVQS